MMITRHWSRWRGGLRRIWPLAAAGIVASALSVGVAAAPSWPDAEATPAGVVTQARSIGITTDDNHAPLGQCTWGAFEKFHEATGVWPKINGDAWRWRRTAAASGWTVVSHAQPRSIVVFQRSVQGASPVYGHVAWVDAVHRGPDGVWVTFTEMNGIAGPGRWNQRTVLDVPGMSYILAP